MECCSQYPWKYLWIKRNKYVLVKLFKLNRIFVFTSFFWCVCVFFSPLDAFSANFLRFPFYFILLLLTLSRIDWYRFAFDLSILLSTKSFINCIKREKWYQLLHLLLIYFHWSFFFCVYLSWDSYGLLLHIDSENKKERDRGTDNEVLNSSRDSVEIHFERFRFNGQTWLKLDVSAKKVHDAAEEYSEGTVFINVW